MPLRPRRLKASSRFQPKLEKLARSKGIKFVAINQNKPLMDQGPFDVIMHKLRCREWRQNIEEFSHDHPEVTVLDPPNAIEQLRNRESMLKDVDAMKLSYSCGMVGVPRQLVVTSDPSSIPEIVTRAGLNLPLVVKPLVADGSQKFHELSLAYDKYCLQELEPPLVLQEFVNHGGILFKVYVVGEAVKLVRRFSLPDVTINELSKISGVFRFPRVSCAAESADEAVLDPDVAELPPQSLLEKLARELRLRLVHADPFC